MDDTVNLAAHQQRRSRTAVDGRGIPEEFRTAMVSVGTDNPAHLPLFRTFTQADVGWVAVVLALGTASGGRGIAHRHAMANQHSRLVRALLACGMASTMLYVAMNVYVAMQWHGYSSVSQTVSELSAVDAPTRSLWVWLAIPYSLLVAAFGWGVWMAAGRNRPLRVLGGLIVANALIGLAWPPMHQREVLAAGGGSLTDTLHIAWTAVTNILFMLQLGFGAAAFGNRFRIYSIATMVMLVAFGVLTGIDAPRLQANLPTPWIGVWERIGIGVFMLWVVVLAVVLLRTRDTVFAAGRRAAAA